MTEEYWAQYKKAKDLKNPNEMWRGIADGRRHMMVREQHPDNLYSICRTDNNYWRHYRASQKIGIDEMAMMIC